MMLMLPYVRYLHAQGALSSTIGPHGSAPFYHFSPKHKEVGIKRRFCLGTEANRCRTAGLPYSHMKLSAFAHLSFVPHL